MNKVRRPYLGVAFTAQARNLLHIDILIGNPLTRQVPATIWSDWGNISLTNPLLAFTARSRGLQPGKFSERT